MELHELVIPFAEHLGTWTGRGRGFYPTIDDFEYTEALTLRGLPGKPFVKVEQKTASPDGAPMHVETGYLRFGQRGHAELILAQPTGQTELLEGGYDAKAGLLSFPESTVVNSSSAKHVAATKRFYRFAGDTLEFEFHMAAVDQDMTQHLTSTLQRRESAEQHS